MSCLCLSGFLGRIATLLTLLVTRGSGLLPKSLEKSCPSGDEGWSWYPDRTDHYYSALFGYPSQLRRHLLPQTATTDQKLFSFHKSPFQDLCHQDSVTRNSVDMPVLRVVELFEDLALFYCIISCKLKLEKAHCIGHDWGLMLWLNSCSSLKRSIEQASSVQDSTVIAFTDDTESW